MFQVLVAEPDDASFQRIRSYLAPEAFHIWRTVNLAECVKGLKAIQADAVLMAFDFPEGGARALLHHLLAEALEVPVVVLGQPGQEEACRRIVLDGAADYLTREPGRWELLDPVLRRAIAYHRLPAQLAASEQKYRTLFHHSPNGLILLDAWGVVLDANRAAEEIFQIGRSHLFGRPLAEQFPAGSEIRRLLESPQDLSRSGNQTVSFSRGGQDLWLEIRLNLMEAYLHRHYLLLVRDVTQARRAEAELAASEAHYRDIFENLGTMIVILDVEDRIVDVNRWVEAWSGEPREKLRGFDLGQYLRDQGLGEWLEQRGRELREEGVMRGEFEARLFGRQAVLGCHATSMVQGGRVTGYRLAFQDITYRVELERQREELQLELLERDRLAAMGRLLQGVAHNLSNPLTILQSTLDWIRSEGVDAVNLAEELQVLDQQVRRLREMLSNMQEKGRREALRQVVRLDLNAILEAELKFLQANPFFKHEVKLLTQLLPLPPILGIYSDFSQSFSNLLNNALDAMFDSPAKTLKVSTACRQQEIVIEIQDTGHGISPEALPQIFDPFFSTKPNVSVDGRPAGTGLGLHACRMLLDPYGVKFEVENRPGAGAGFRLRIPIQPRRGVRALLVEDESAVRLGLQSGLRAFNVNVTAVESAEAALSLANGFDVYLVDASLPGMSGLDYIAQLRARQPEAKVLLLAGADFPQVEPRARTLGVNLVLLKPVTFREVAQAIALLDTPNSPVAAGW